MSSSKSKRRCLVSESSEDMNEASPWTDPVDDEVEEKRTPEYELHPTKKSKDGFKYVSMKKSKRKAPYWVDYWMYLDNADMIRAECKFCERNFAADPNTNGTKNVKKHWTTCPKNPANKSKGKQTHLIFEPVDGEEGDAKLKYKDVNLNDVRDALGRMIILDELPFRFVEKVGFKYFMSIACPAFHMPSRMTIARDCYQLYCDERLKLKEFLRNSCQRVSVTTDTWTSIQRINYMCLTAHFIDNDWKLQKRIINFCPISSHKGDAIGRPVEDCLNSWGLCDKLFTVTVDNASSNDVACGYLRNMVRRKGGINEGKYLHMRCIAHIINLIVWDGLKDHVQCIDRTRAVVKFVKNSPAGLLLFKEVVEKCKIESKSSLSLDVPTRWNSTYTMLDTAQKFKGVFSRMSLPREYEGNTSSPDDAEWDKVEKLVVFLREFYDLTNRVSGSLYVTSNTLFFHIGHILDLLNQWTVSDDPDFRTMAFQMKLKFDKYWGDVEKMNMLIYLAVILDPKFKFLGVQIALQNMYGVDRGTSLANKVREFSNVMFDEYRKLYAPVIVESEQTSDSMSIMQPMSQGGVLSFKNNIQEQIKKQISGADGGRFVRSEFDRYLNEQMGEDEEKDILTWWKLNGPRFPVIARMARDVLAIPVSTVASESAFSAGGRHVDQFRSSLTPKMAQALICGQDWLRPATATSKMNVEEKLEELEQLEKDLEKTNLEDEMVFVTE
ncbi:zinc finger BED domain-containing protein RICESLEEPER 2-like [Spinacia oleracea]|uniref:Zinc finger BED domain-containing protein RICESLEEPER 2-like n=1 Tax=Spinacia oleracea TaxID=3562 RepID=A0ABM3R7R0_SPIOL|nr:zinc finger BED domain-containing protein RICESLEEPER 2-like [Spinacia oleracea]